MFVYQIHVMSTNEHTTIWVNTNQTCLLKGSRFLNPNTTCLLNGSIMSTHLSNFIKAKQKYTNFSINQIDLNYKKPKKKLLYKIQN